MLVELKNGETLNGHLVSCDTYMNLTLKEVVSTSAEGDKFFRLAEAYVRGNNVSITSVSGCRRYEMSDSCRRSNTSDLRTRSWMLSRTNNKISHRREGVGAEEADRLEEITRVVATGEAGAGLEEDGEVEEEAEEDESLRTSTTSALKAQRPMRAATCPSIIRT